jgi:hypothetical protein
MTDTRTLDDLCYIESAPPAKVIRIYADAWKSEQISATATVTVHAVETGARVTDHYLPDQLAAKASLFISGSPIRGDLDPDFVGKVQSFPFVKPVYPNNTPLLSPGGLLNAAEGAVSEGLQALGLGGGPNQLPDNLSVLSFSQDPRGRLRKVLEQLLEWRQNAVLVNVNFSQARVENLAISSITLARTSDDGDSGTIDLEFQQMNFVSTQSAAAIPVPKEPRAKPKGDSFTVSAEEADGNQKSLAAVGFDSARSGLGL